MEVAILVETTVLKVLSPVRVGRHGGSKVSWLPLFVGRGPSPPFTAEQRRMPRNQREGERGGSRGLGPLPRHGNR